MEKESKPRLTGIEFVLSSLRDARKRLTDMDSEEKLRDPIEIWEAYCDVEQAIEVSKFVFDLHDRLGKVRSLKVSAKNDPESMPLDELVSKYGLVNSAIASAEEAYEKGTGELAIEFARRARDELKILLLGRRKMKRSKSRKR